jgi:hypothetical protein
MTKLVRRMNVSAHRLAVTPKPSAHDNGSKHPKQLRADERQNTARRNSGERI